MTPADGSAMRSEEDEQMALLRAHMRGRRGAGAGRPASGLAQRDAAGKRQLVTELKPWHEAVVDYFIANPSAKQVDVAKHFGVTQAWLSTLVNTDAFRGYAAERLAKHQEKISQQVAVLASEVATKALGVVNDKLDMPDAVSIGEAAGAAKLALAALGIGAVGGGKGVVNNNTNLTVIAAHPEALAAAREKARQLSASIPVTHSMAGHYHVLDTSPALSAPREDSPDVEDAQEVLGGEDGLFPA